MTAVPETVGNAGLLLADKSPGLFAAAVSRVLSDAALARSLAAAGRTRAAAFDLGRSSGEFVSRIERAIRAA